MIDQACLSLAMKHDSLKVKAESFMVRGGENNAVKKFTWLFWLSLLLFTMLVV